MSCIKKVLQKIGACCLGLCLLLFSWAVWVVDKIDPPSKWER